MRRITIAVMLTLLIAVLGTGVASAQGNSDGDARGLGQHSRGDLRDTICGPVDAKLGAGACTATVIFLAPLAVVGGLFVGGRQTPFVLSGSAGVAMCGAGALIFPNRCNDWACRQGLRL